MTTRTPLRWNLTDALRFFGRKDGKIPPPGSDKALMIEAADAIEKLEDCAEALRCLLQARASGFSDQEALAVEGAKQALAALNLK